MNINKDDLINCGFDTYVDINTGKEYLKKADCDDEFEEVISKEAMFTQKFIEKHKNRGDIDEL